MSEICVSAMNHENPVTTPASRNRAGRKLHAMKSTRYAAAESRRMLRATAQLQKQLAIATELDKSTISRWCSGDTESPVGPYHDLLDRLARNRYTDPSPLIVHSMAVVARALADDNPPEMLETLLHRALHDETMSQAVADVAEMEFYRGEMDLAGLRELLEGHIAKAIRARAIIDAMLMQKEAA